VVRIESELARFQDEAAAEGIVVAR
jgi:hypothetical protein